MRSCDKKRSPFTRGFCCFCLVLASHLVCGQQVIQKLNWEGLKRHRVSYLNHFLTQDLGQSIDSIALAQDLQRLVNLPSVSQAQARIDSTEEGWNLTVSIEEAWTLFPIVNFGGIRDNIWGQVGATELNLLGGGIQATAYYLNNDRQHNGQLYLRVPYLWGSRWGASLNLLQWGSIEPLYFEENPTFYIYQNRTVGLSLIRELDYQHWIELGASYFVESYVKDARHLGEVTMGPDSARIPKALYKLTHNLDRINYHFYALSGWQLRQYAQMITYVPAQGRENFYIYWADFLYFKTLGDRGNLASRFRAGLSVNQESPFAPFVLDSQVNIRGSGNRIDRGTAVLVWNLEYRHAIWDRNRFAAQLVAFSDAGTWREPGGELNDLLSAETFQHFIGGGVRFIYKNAHNAMLRLDYGLDWRMPERRGIVIGVGQYF